MAERQETNPPPSPRRAKRKWNCSMYSVLQWASRLIHSLYWKIVMILFTVILLFGSPIQTFLHKDVDVYFNIMYIVALGVFAFDMVVHLMTDKDYFGFHPPAFLFCLGTKSPPRRGGRSSNSGADKLGIGSFKFWCDLVSTAMLFYDIKYTNAGNHKQEDWYIYLSAPGVPYNFDSVMNKPVPLDMDVPLLVVVAKVSRVARLIRSATVVELANWINFYWYVERLNPWWYWNEYKEAKERKRRLTREAEEKKRRETRGLMRRASWGALEVATRAAVKTHALDAKFTATPGRKIKGAYKKTGRFLGFLPEKNLELRRHIAATKIQRAWRNTQTRPTGAPSEDGGHSMDDEPLWGRGRSPGGSKIKGRSMLGMFQQPTTKNVRENVNSTQKPANPKKPPTEEENRPESQVGNAMGELTGQRVALAILCSMILTILFSYHEDDATKPATMVILHSQTMKHFDPSESFQLQSRALFERPLLAARKSAIIELYQYDVYPAVDYNSSETDFLLGDLSPLTTFDVRDELDTDLGALREREKLKITVVDERGATVGHFLYRQERLDQAIVVLASTVFVLLVWFLGVTAFAGPVMTLVIIPIERMVRLLGMLMLDPLGYQSTSRFKKFLLEEDALVKKSQWTKEVLKGMETSFLMSTILRIGSLMKVGFGSAGVEIIRNNLQSGQNNNMLILNSQGSMVACIFLFCDIRQFTDATECLQEEVFVFTNRIAAVVHSICNAYGGSANKNVGDAFLMSWRLEDDSMGGGGRFASRTQSLQAKNNQADKALLSVVRICIALQYNDYYVSTMSDTARTALLTKLKNRPGPVVQMGFGLHAGKAVQGAIGSQRKIDATYVSEAVERAEFLESSTKQYGVKMLMSDDFHQLLSPSNRRRCRKVDQILFLNEDEVEGYEDDALDGDVMELFTYDMDVEALWRTNMGVDYYENNSDSESVSERGVRKDSYGRPIPINTGGSTRGSANLMKRTRRLSMRRFDDIKQNPSSSDELRSAMQQAAAESISGVEGAAGSTHFSLDKTEDPQGGPNAPGPGELILPTRTVIYSSNIWLQEDMRRIRHAYTHVIFNKFNAGLQAYYAKDWVTARQCFSAVVERFPDGPSKYFLSQMDKYGGKPPKDFIMYGRA